MNEKMTTKERAKVAGTARWKNVSKEERSALMSKARKLGYERQQAKLKAIREESA